MTSEAAVRPIDEVNAATDALANRKNLGKVPKRIHKAEREKLKRDELNKLFFALADTLDLTDPNNGKASILCEATRFLKDVFDQIENLRKENASLLSEAQYVTVEKNELKEENSALETQIGELQSKLEEKLAQSKPDLNKPPTEFYQSEAAQSHHLNSPAVYVFPHQPEHHPYLETAPLASQPASHVSKPHARYPTSADVWPFQVLRNEPETRKELQLSETDLELNISSTRK